MGVTPYWQSSDGRLVIYHGRAEDVLPTLPNGSVDIVMTSPPYNRGDMTGGLANVAGGYRSYDDQMPHDQYVCWQRAILNQSWRLTAPFGAIYYNHRPRIQDGEVWLPLELNPGLPLRQIIVWAREMGTNWAPGHYKPTHEWIMLLAHPGFRLLSKSESSAGDVWWLRPELKDYGHPCPFPAALPKKVLTTSGAQSVLDPFMGVGSTLAAALTLGRRGIGIELDEAYCEIAVKRLEDPPLLAMARPEQAALFGEAG